MLLASGRNPLRQAVEPLRLDVTLHLERVQRLRPSLGRRLAFGHHLRTPFVHREIGRAHV